MNQMIHFHRGGSATAKRVPNCIKSLLQPLWLLSIIFLLALCLKFCSFGSYKFCLSEKNCCLSPVPISHIDSNKISCRLLVCVCE